ncbi:hypothetical protein [Actinoplanes subglobosus]|uniref:Uncharacterized protein n=1 Tax=Actinoplanes subglobosus TaxID=1547892 RepID=A0ABV8J0A7_9ACTN
MEPATIDVRIVCSDTDDEDIHELAQNLREALLDTDVDDVRQGTSGPAPAGAKSGEVLAVGALLVTLAPPVVENLMVVIASWLSRQPNDVELEIDGQRFRGQVTRPQRDQLVSAYLRRLERES